MAMTFHLPLNQYDQLSMVTILVSTGAVLGEAEARRLIDGGGVILNSEKLNRHEYSVDPERLENAIVQVGKLHAYHVKAEKGGNGRVVSIEPKEVSDGSHRLYKDFECTEEALCPVGLGFCTTRCAAAVNISGPKRYRCCLINLDSRDQEISGMTLYQKTESSGKVSDGRYH